MTGDPEVGLFERYGLLLPDAAVFTDPVQWPCSH